MSPWRARWTSNSSSIGAGASALAGSSGTLVGCRLTGSVIIIGGSSGATFQRISLVREVLRQAQQARPAIRGRQGSQDLAGLLEVLVNDFQRGSQRVVSGQ